LFVVACKEEAATPAASPEQKPAAQQPAPNVERNRPRPSLPDEAMREQRVPNEEPRDYSDPAVREEMRQRREERRKEREEMLDTNKDGVVSPEERQARLKPMAERLDKNGDGKLTPEELAHSNRRMRFDDPAAVDADHNGEISLAELDAAVQVRREQLRDRWRGRGGRGSADLRPD
jgi:hypothetical protein